MTAVQSRVKCCPIASGTVGPLHSQRARNAPVERLALNRRQLTHIVLLAPLAGLATTACPLPADAAGALTAFYRSRQQQNGGALLLGPILVSRQRLQDALTAVEGSPDAAAFKVALERLRAASMGCYVVDGADAASLSTAGASTQEYK
jgi:hypothetical protein